MSGDSPATYSLKDPHADPRHFKGNADNWRLGIVLTALAAFMGLVLAAPNTTVTRRASAATLCVNPGGTGGCFSSIQAAINAAAPGDTINVAAGTYTEMVQVNKTVNLRGAQAGVDARTRSTANESIVTHGDGPIQILADNVVVDGFTIQGASNNPSNPPFTALGTGIWTNPGFSTTQGGHQILNNIIKDNILGLYLHNTGAIQTQVRFNLFQNNNLAGPASGDAILSELGLSNALIDSNKFTGHIDAAVFILGPPGTNINISNNESSANGRAFALGSLTSVSITGNVTSGSTFAASADIRIFGGITSLSIRENSLSGGAGDAIRIDDILGGSPNSDVTMSCNSIQGYAGDGIELVAGGYTGSLNAVNNWWGSATGPTIASNPGGTGQAIVDPGAQVVYAPFLTAAVDANPGASGFQCACAPPPMNMISWWPGDGNANDIQDGNSGTLQNGATFGAGLTGQAFSLDGVDDFINVPDANNLDFAATSPITVDMWVFRTAANPTIHIIGKRVACGSINYQLAIDQTRGLQFTGEPGTGVGTNVDDVPLDVWTHLAGTFDGTTWRLYINGIEVANTSAGGTLGPANTAPFEIGASGTCGNTFPGLIDEVEIFSTALSAQAIQAIYTAGSSGKCKCSGITCPATIIQSNDVNQCGAVVTYAAPTPGGTGCGTITCLPASGSFFPKGITTVTCTAALGPTCSFTITVNDTQPPAIICPANVTAVGTPGGGGVVVTYPPPTATDNCPGVTAACVPPSGSTFPVGTSTVTCTATDASGNTATCTFTVGAFDVCLQDDTNPGTVLLFNSATGDYRFCCGGNTFTGKGTVKKIGSTITLSQVALDRRVQAQIDGAQMKGNAQFQSPPGTIRCTITDRNTANNACVCN